MYLWLTIVLKTDDWSCARYSGRTPRRHFQKRSTNLNSKDRLEISDKTVEKHRSSLMKKLRVGSVAELVRLVVLAESAAR